MRQTLMVCKSCHQLISTKAETCPHCGHAYVPSFIARVRRTQWGCLWGLLALIVVIFLVAMFGG
jgi:uncharacterized paraquat-inducible protein A